MRNGCFERSSPSISPGQKARSAPTGPGVRHNGRRFNDGVIDPAGRLVIGSLSLVGRSAENVLLRLESDGSVTTPDYDLLLADGLGFSPDGTTLYLIDNLAQTLCGRVYDANGMLTGVDRCSHGLTDASPTALLSIMLVTAEPPVERASYPTVQRRWNGAR